MKCLDQGTLQAYLDRELPGMHHAASHLEGCATCRDRLGRLRTTVERVNACMDSLAPPDPLVVEAIPRIAARSAGRHWRWATVALAGGLMGLALFLSKAPRAKRVAHVQKPAPPVALLAATVREPSPHIKPARVRARRPRPQPTLDDFVALDDADPMQMGMVVRVMLPLSDASTIGGAQEIAADVMIGEDGRARAFRLVR
jgi:hypothetical protein